MGWRRFKRWNSCLLWFAASLSAFCLTVSCIGVSDDVEATGTTSTFSEDKAPGCTSSNSDFITDSKLMLVSTLDGKLSALNVNDDSGQLLWSVPADSRPLLSSSISKLEIMHEGVPTRYIPSLDGGLYRYDGESIEAVPMTAETLLSSSFRLADNTVMIGGKDVLSYGLDPKTGQVRYACGVKGCRMFGEEVTKEEDVVVVNRQTQTVRAVDSRTGSEKWNFSVGQHDVTFLKGQRKVLTGNGGNGNDDASDVTCVVDDESDSQDVSMGEFSNSIKIVVPEGMVVGVNPENLQSVTWKYKFHSPVSNAWLLYRGELRQIDMFGSANIPAISSFEPEEQPLHQPLLYVGMHQSQFYVQPSAQMQDRMEQTMEMYSSNDPPSTYLASIPRVAWKPYLNTAHWRTPVINNRQQISSEPHDNAGASEQETDHCEEGDNALTIWHENYPFDNGFYLYPEITVPVPVPEQKGDKTADGNHSDDVHESSMLDDFLPVTLWNWWKEVIAISVLTSVIVHLILTRVQKATAAICNDTSIMKSVSSNSLIQEGNEREMDFNTPIRQNSDDFRTEYVSRYASDFEHIQILGKGGFGIVFETRNVVDDCHYAVKRIALPNSDGAKEKVMREVKALAKLDHVGIVRYFHAWIESPPPGWQEERDKEIEESECITSPTQFGTETHTSYRHSTKHSPKRLGIEHLVTSQHNKSCKKPSPMDFLQNPFGGNNFEFSETELKKGGSEEFSIQSQSNSIWDDDGDEESGSFSCGMGTPKLTSFQLDESVDVEFKLSDSEFSKDQSTNNNCSKNIPFSVIDDDSIAINEQEEHNILIDDTNSSFKIVFEDSGCAEKSSKGSTNEDVCIGIQNSQSTDMIGSQSSGSNLISSNKNSHTRTHSRTHSRSLSRDLAKLTYEKEAKYDKNKANDDQSRTVSSPTPMLFLYIQMQLCKRESLKDWLSSNTLNRDRHMVLDIFDQITCAIEYVHDCGLMHRDLKPSNIFFSLDGVVKMGDFGLVTALPEEQNETLYGDSSPFKKHTAQVGTQLYMSPEQTSGKVYSQKVDIFSLGVILFELLYPFATQMERVSTLLSVKKQVFPERFRREMHSECDVVRWLLSPSSEDRPTAKEILASDLLKEFEGRRMPRRFRTRTVSQNSS